MLLCSGVVGYAHRVDTAIYLGGAPRSPTSLLRESFVLKYCNAALSPMSEYIYNFIILDHVSTERASVSDQISLEWIGTFEEIFAVHCTDYAILSLWRLTLRLVPSHSDVAHVSIVFTYINQSTYSLFTALP